MKRISYVLAVLCVFGLLLAKPQQVKATPVNVGPPSGAILDLNGQALPSVWTLYSVPFTATLSATDITFAFRNDPGFTGMDDVSVTTGAGPNLIMNGGFESGLLGGLPVGWTYDNVYGARFGGVVAASTCGGVAFAPRTGSNDWCDGATQAYDAIDQIIPTTIGDTYTISFYLNQFDQSRVHATHFQDLSTNGGDGTSGNGIDTLVYAQSGLPPAATPEPATLTLLGSGLVGLAGMIRKRRMAA